MQLSKQTINDIETKIEGHEVCSDYEKDELELSQDGFLIFVAYGVYAKFVECLNYHNEVPYNNVEDLSYWEFDGAEIDEISAYDEDGEEVVIENAEVLKY